MSINLMSAIFRTEFRDLQDEGGNTTKASTAKFVCIALADHANDEGEGAYPSIAKLAYKTSLSRTTIINALDALKHNGILTAKGTSKWDTVNYTVNSECFSPDSQPTLLVNPLDSPSQATLPPPVNPLDSNHPLTIHKPNEIPQNMPIEWYVQHSLPIPPTLTSDTAAREEALNEFESALGFGQLTWDKLGEWSRFKRWVIERHGENPRCFRDYAEWRRGKGKYDAMNNKQIRLNPAMFIDTGYPAFLAHSSMYPEEEKYHIL